MMMMMMMMMMIMHRNGKENENAKYEFKSDTFVCIRKSLIDGSSAMVSSIWSHRKKPQADQLARKSRST